MFLKTALEQACATRKKKCTYELKEMIKNVEIIINLISSEG
jgi:hypothetical protein